MRTKKHNATLKLGLNLSTLDNLIDARATLVANPTWDNLTSDRTITDYFKVDALGQTHISNLYIRKEKNAGEELTLKDYIENSLSSILINTYNIEEGTFGSSISGHKEIWTPDSGSGKYSYVYINGEYYGYKKEKNKLTLYEVLTLGNLKS